MQTGLGQLLSEVPSSSTANGAESCPIKRGWGWAWWGGEPRLRGGFPLDPSPPSHPEPQRVPAMRSLPVTWDQRQQSTPSPTSPGTILPLQLSARAAQTTKLYRACLKKCRAWAWLIPCHLPSHPTTKGRRSQEAESGSESGSITAAVSTVMPVRRAGGDRPPSPLPWGSGADCSTDTRERGV